MHRNYSKVPLWLRIYLMVFGLITLVVLFSSYHIISVSNDRNIQREYSISLDKHVMLYNALKIYANTVIDKFEYDPDLEHEMLARAVQNYGRYYTDNRSYIAMTNEAGEKLYSSIAPEDERAMGLTPGKDGRRSCVIRRIGTRTVLFVSGWMEIGRQLFRLDYANDITDLIDYQKSLAMQISLWLAVGMVLLALGLYFSIRQTLRPLEQLSTQAQAIAQGRYEHRITVKRSDEIGQLAVDFNRMAEAIQANMELLQQNVKEREAFIASLAHELKTPLTSIMGYSSLLQNYNLAEKDREQALIFIYNESKRLDGISKKLLELFRLGDGRVIDKKKVAVSSLLQQLKIIAQFSLSEKEQSLDIDSSVDRVAVDQELFLVLLSNLVENASRASENGAIIQLKVYLEDSSVVFGVKDDGCGIPEEHLNKVFQPFFMLDRARDRTKNGHGLGLSLCQAIAQAHDGTIYIESSPGKGTTVYALIPDYKSLQISDTTPIEP